tara:strand:+ start:187 stop:765 length:579 start_codon:yes stop_codon:yes gene_type:complete
MNKRTAFVGAILSLIPFGQPLMIKTSVLLSSSIVMIFVPEKVYANSADYYLKKLEVIYLKKGEENTTIYYANRLLQIDPLNIDAYWYRAYAKVELGLYEDGINDYKRSIVLGDKDSMTYTNIGYAFSELGDNYKAISYYNKSLQMDEKNITGYLNRGVAKKNIGDIKGACNDWIKASYLGDETASNWVRDQC